jgi:FSR family fosmidomycin resistance protein-like MFS transporter
VVIGGLGVSGFHPQGYKLTGLFAGKYGAAATSWFLVGGNVGVALGPLAGTALAVRFGPEGTGFMFLPGLAFAVALWWLIPRWTQGQGAAAGFVRPRRAGAPSGPGAGMPAPAAIPVPPAMVGLGAHRRTLAVAVLVALVALRSMVSNSLISFVPLYYVRVAGTGEAEASRVLAGMLLAGAVATLGGGYLADRLGRMPVLAGTLLLVPPLLLLFVAAEPGSIAAAASLWTAGAMVTASFSITVVLAQDLWYERRALASGVIVGFAFGVGGLLVPVVGTIADAWGLPAALRLLAAIPLATLALVAILAALLKPSR